MTSPATSLDLLGHLAALDRHVQRREHDRARELARQSVPNEEPVTAALLATVDISETGEASRDFDDLVRGAFRAADGAWAAGEVEFATYALSAGFKLLFHPVLHAEGGSRLVEDPDTHLVPMRSSSMFAELTSGPPRTARRRGLNREEHVTLLPGAYPRFSPPLARALRSLPGVSLRTRELAVQDNRFRWLGPNTRMLATRIAMHERGGRARDIAGELPRYGHLVGSPDMIVADWADRGAMWVSWAAPAETRLVVRLHGMDLLSPWVHLIDWGAVDDVIFVSEPLRDLGRRILGDALAHTEVHVVPHGVEPRHFTTEKTPVAERTIGMIGWGQPVKDPLWTFEVLRELHAHDPAWRLKLLGDPPAGGSPFAARVHEVLEGPLGGSIEVIGYTDDVPSHTSDMGFVVSSSTRESFHLAVAEGALSGAVPVVRDWPVYSTSSSGADSLFPQDWVVDSPARAAERILAFADPRQRDREGRRARREIRRFVPARFEAAIAEVISPGAYADGLADLAQLEQGIRPENLLGTARRLFDLADVHWEAGSGAAAVRSVAAAMRLMFHRELHSDSLSSPLVEDPDSWLEPLRASTVGRLLTDPVPALAQEPAPRTGNSERVVITSGPFGHFYLPVARALAAHPEGQVRVIDSRRSGFTTLGIDPGLIRFRLDHAAGVAPHEGRHASVLKALTAGFADAGVLLAEWAGKDAMIASLTAPPGARVIVRLHGVDTLRPWIHLIDWSRVESVVCVSEGVARLVSRLLGARVEGKLRIIGNLVSPHIAAELDRAASKDRTAGEPRTLAMVGWGRRVKDPLWALDVLQRLLEDDERWRLVLIGPGFPDSTTASGEDYAAEFSRRAAHLGDRLVQIGKVSDVATYLAHADFVISASRRESFHLGALEGVLAGAVPVVRDWPMLRTVGGARAVFPEEWIVDSTEEAVARIRGFSDPTAWAQESEAARRIAADLFSPSRAENAWRALVYGPGARLQELIDEKRDSEALELIDKLLAAPGTGVPELRTVLRATRLLGEPTRRLAAFERVLQLRPTKRTERAARRQLGRLREMDTDWHPPLERAVAPYEPVPERILHVLKVSEPDHGRGYSMRAWYTLNGQRQIGLDAIGVTSIDFDPEGTPGDGPRDVQGVPHHRLVRERVFEEEPLDEFLTAWANGLARKVEELRPAVIHAHSGFHGFDAALVSAGIAQAAEVPLIYEVRGFFETLWSRDAARSHKGETFTRRHERELECMDAAAAVVTLSESMKADIVARGIAPEKVHVVPNAVDVNRFVPGPRPQYLVERYGLEGRFVFGYVSNLDIAREGQEYLIHAAVALRRRGIPAVALIVGDGRRMAELREVAADAGAGDAVIFTGQVPHAEVQGYYRLCDVFVVPRVRETVAELVTPLKPYEAMALRIPLVVSDLAALEEVIGHGARGTSFEADNADALADVLADAYTDREPLLTKADEALDWVRNTRTWKANAEMYREIYAESTNLI